MTEDDDRIAGLVTWICVLGLYALLTVVAGCPMQKWNTACVGPHPWGYSALGVLVSALVLTLGRRNPTLRASVVGQGAVVVAGVVGSTLLGRAFGHPQFYHDGPMSLGPYVGMASSVFVLAAVPFIKHRLVGLGVIVVSVAVAASDLSLLRGEWFGL